MNHIASGKWINLHTAGATVRHAGPYSDLEVPSGMQTLDRDFIDKWVLPFYMQDVANPDQYTVEQLQALWDELDEVVISRLLTEFNWRPRLVGAWLVALQNQLKFLDHLGRLLLRSDVCHAGSGYCYALALLNEPAAADYLDRYLGYYLTQPNLWFDQGDALAALRHLDRINGTNLHTRHLDAWHAFTANKPAWELEKFSARLARTLSGIRSVQAAVGSRVPA